MNTYADIEQMPEKPEIAQLIASATDRPAAITNVALTNTIQSIVQETVDTFVSILASEAANMVLKVMATGGVYLAGVFPPHLSRS